MIISKTRNIFPSGENPARSQSSLYSSGGTMPARLSNGFFNNHPNNFVFITKMGTLSFDILK